MLLNVVNLRLLDNSMNDRLDFSNAVHTLSILNDNGEYYFLSDKRITIQSRSTVGEILVEKRVLNICTIEVLVLVEKGVLIHRGT